MLGFSQTWWSSAVAEWKLVYNKSTTSVLEPIIYTIIKPHHKRNQYLRARLDTCTDVNMILASVYKLVFCDPDLKKLAPSKLEIGNYTPDTVKLVGSCTFYLVHPDTKPPQEVTFYVASNNGMFCCLVPSWLHLAWYSHTLDWTISHLECYVMQALLMLQLSRG